MKIRTDIPPGEDVFRGKLNPKNPHDLTVDTKALRVHQMFMAAFARDVGGLWDPRREKGKQDIYGIGMECGQYPLILPDVLQFAKGIGCHTIQPSGNQIDLARAATDHKYRGEVWETFRKARMPFTSVSVHVDAYAAIAVLGNPRAGMFTPPEIKEKGLDPKATSAAHINKIALMIIGAAQFGIDLHLFWGDPEDIKVYGWQPQSPDEVKIMREKFVKLVKPLVNLAKRLGVSLCHEIHFGTIAMTADDFIEIWIMLGRPKNFCVGFDPSHFWHGETWVQALDKLRRAGIEVHLAHAKNVVVHPGRPLLGHQMDDRFRGQSFAMLDDPAGLVSMHSYLGMLTTTGIVRYWFRKGLPVPLHVEAENPYFRINEVTRKGVNFLRGLADGLQLPKGHFTDAMRR
jgi:sugar phosphate isomerase/epimerase